MKVNNNRKINLKYSCFSTIPTHKEPSYLQTLGRFVIIIKKEFWNMHNHMAMYPKVNWDILLNKIVSNGTFKQCS